MKSSDDKSLIRRYLIWCYKTTKEELDRIDRKFTQLQVDQLILSRLLKKYQKKSSPHKESFSKKIEVFKSYIVEKEKQALGQKYTDPGKKLLHPDYDYLKDRLEAIEETVLEILGENDLKKIRLFYQEEMVRRILQTKEHS